MDGSSISMLPTSWELRRSSCFLGPHSVVGLPWEHSLCPQQLPGSRFHAPSIHHSASVGWTAPSAGGAGSGWWVGLGLKYRPQAHLQRVQAGLVISSPARFS